MPEKLEPTNEIHNKAYSDFMSALRDKSQRDAAKQNPLIGTVLKKLSDDDFDILARVASYQTVTNHGPPLAPPVEV